VVVKVENSSVKEFSDIDVYAMLYDDTNTVYAVGKTVLSNIKGRESTAAVFTWGDIASPANADFIVTQH
jgi:nitric oxide reductase large subunit